MEGRVDRLDEQPAAARHAARRPPRPPRETERVPDAEAISEADALRKRVRLRALQRRQRQAAPLVAAPLVEVGAEAGRERRRRRLERPTPGDRGGVDRVLEVDEVVEGARLLVACLAEKPSEDPPVRGQRVGVRGARVQRGEAPLALGAERGLVRRLQRVAAPARRRSPGAPGGSARESARSAAQTARGGGAGAAAIRRREARVGDTTAAAAAVRASARASEA